MNELSDYEMINELSGFSAYPAGLLILKRDTR